MDKKINEEIYNAVGYKQQTIEKVLNLLNTLPVSDYIATKSKMEIYETLLKPEYTFDKKGETTKK